MKYIVDIIEMKRTIDKLSRKSYYKSLFSKTLSGEIIFDDNIFHFILFLRYPYTYNTVPFVSMV